MAQLYDRDEKTIHKHVNNVLTEGETGKERNTQKMRVPKSDMPVPFCSLDVIISVGYMVHSQRGVEFRRWATSILKQYILQGYAANEKLLSAQGKTIELQSWIIAGSFEGEEDEVLKAVNANGPGFRVLKKKQGDPVKAGDPVIEADIASLSKTYDMSTMLIVTNPNGKEITFKAPCHVSRGDIVVK